MTYDKERPFFSASRSPETLTSLGDYLARLYGLDGEGGSIGLHYTDWWAEFEYQVVSFMVAAWKTPPYIIPYSQEAMKRWLPNAPRSQQGQRTSGIGPENIPPAFGIALIECLDAAKALASGFGNYERAKGGRLQRLFRRSPGLPRLVGGKYAFSTWPLEPAKSDAYREQGRVEELYNKLPSEDLGKHLCAMRPLAIITRFANCHPCPHMTRHYDWTAKRPEFSRIALADYFVPNKLGIQFPKSAREGSTLEEVDAELLAYRQGIAARRASHGPRLKDFQEGKPRGPR